MQQLKRNYYSVREFVSRRGKTFTRANWLSLFVLADKQESSFQSKSTVGPFGTLVSQGEDFSLTLSRSQHRFFLDLVCQFRLDSHMSCLSVPSHLPPPFLTAFWDVADDPPQVPLPLPPSLLWGMFEAELPNPCGSLTQKDPQLQPWHDAHCPWLCGEGDSCRAVLTHSHSHHRAEHFPLSASDLRCLLVAVLGAGGRGWLDRWHLWVRMELLCLVLAFRAWARSPVGQIVFTETAEEC